MNLYVGLIQDTVEFIEANIREEISLETVSRRFFLSEFHFNRMFRTVTGRTLKQYILGRKLSSAMEKLSATDEKVIDIALDYGFQYPEVFSRAFKKQFGLSPEMFRKDRPILESIPKAQIVERNIVNYQGRMTLKGEGVFLKELHLEGFGFEVDANSDDFRYTMQESADAFLTRAQKSARLKKDKFYAAVHCHGEDNGEYAVFYGMEAIDEGLKEGFESKMVPEGWYQRFLYTGDMYDIRESFMDDLYRWIMVKEVELLYNGIGMLNIFQDDYPSTHAVQILVPVKNPK
jgi:AraC family transcriptional regulator